MVHSFYKYPFIQASYMCSMHSIVTTFRGAVIKVEVANFCAAMDTLIDQDGASRTLTQNISCQLAISLPESPCI